MSYTIKKWTEDLNRHFSNENIQMTNRHTKRCSMSLIIKEKQIKTIMGYHLTLIRMAIINKSTNKCCQGCVEKVTHGQCWWDCELMQPLWKMVEFLQNIQDGLPMTSDSNSGYISKGKKNTSLKEYMHYYVYCSIICNSQDNRSNLCAHQQMSGLNSSGTYTR